MQTTKQDVIKADNLLTGYPLRADDAVNEYRKMNEETVGQFSGASAVRLPCGSYGADAIRFQKLSATLQALHIAALNARCNNQHASLCALNQHNQIIQNYRHNNNTTVEISGLIKMGGRRVLRYVQIGLISTDPCLNDLQFIPGIN